MPTPTPVRIVRLTGAAIDAYLPDVARLRLRVFREFPYLYDGMLEQEQKHLRLFADSPGSVVVVALAGDVAVGASTGLPMIHEPPHLHAPFIAQGRDPGACFYLGESVLLPEYRGRGFGVRFFEEREAHARTLGRFEIAAFCAVQRPASHPRRPEGYVPLEQFWTRRGYARRQDLAVQFTWQDIDEPTPTPHPMVFWIKPLA